MPSHDDERSIAWSHDPGHDLLAQYSPGRPPSLDDDPKRDCFESFPWVEDTRVRSRARHLLLDPEAHTTVPAVGEIEQTFYALVRLWRKDTTAVSVDSRKREHPAYRQIVAMGVAVLPFLLRELERMSAHFDMALQEITGANPVPTNARGDMNRVRKAWLRWAKDHNIV
jgi:hypothetical protein